MKITDPDVIQNGEKDLIQALTDDLDMETIKGILQNRMNPESISSRGGEIVVHNSEIAFKLDFSIEISGSLMFDRQGNYIPEPDETDDMDDLASEDSEEQFDMNASDDDLESDLESDLEAEPDSAVEEKSDVENDMDDILKESRDFWEEKKINAGK